MAHRERSVSTGGAWGGALVVAASLQFGIVVVLGTLLLRRGLVVEALLAIRFAVAALVLTVVSAALRRPLLPARGERLRLGMLGLGGYAIEAALFFAAIKHGTATAVTLLFFTYPVAVAVVSRLLGERSQGRLVAGSLAAAVAGAAIVVVSGGTVAIRPLGIVLALGSAVMFTIYLLGVDRTMRRTDPLAASAWVSVWAAAGLFISLIVLRGRIVPPDMGGWFMVAGMGVATAGAFTCLMAGLRMLGPVRTSIVAAAEPLSSAVMASIVLHDPFRTGTAVGGVLILAAATVASLTRRSIVEEIP